jgi:3-hydroxyacyl-CoA dehydrogenase
MLGPEATEDDRRIGLALSRRLGKLAIVETAPTLSLHDRFQQTLWRAADALVDLGQSPYAVDDALRSWGMAHPPYEAADAFGLQDVAAFERTDGARNWSSFMVQLGRDGRSGGRGIYIYDGQGVAQSDPDALYKINTERAPQTSIPAPQIARLIVGAMANTGAKILREGVVPRAAELDVLSVFTQLVPNWRGGVMHAVGAEGLLRTTREMQALDHPDRDLWTPDPVFAELIKYGRSFDDL